jgi:hypothetical protein
VRLPLGIIYIGQWETFGEYYDSGPHGVGVYHDTCGFALDGGWLQGRRHGKDSLFYGPIVYVCS